MAGYLEQEWTPLLTWIVETLAAGWGARGAQARPLRALLWVAVGSETWNGGKAEHARRGRDDASAVRCAARRG